MQIAWTATPGTYREFAGQMRLGARGESGDLLVPDVHPLDLALPADGIRNAVQAIADNAIDALDAGCREDLGELIRHCLRHRSLSCAEGLPRQQYPPIQTWHEVRPAMKSDLIHVALARCVELRRTPW